MTIKGGKTVEESIIRASINAGIGGVIAALIIILIYKLASRLFLEIGGKMVSAFEKQANSIDDLTKSIQGFVLRDDFSHREQLVLLKYLAQSHQEYAHVLKGLEECPHLGSANEDHKH